MRTLLLLIFSIVCLHTTFGQTFVDPVAPYQKDSLLPRFQLLLVDSTSFSYTQLPAKKPVVIIYFSPDCGHCQVEAEALTKEMHLVKEATFVWASYKAIPDIKAFAKQYQFAAHKNIITGRDTEYAIPSFFRIRFTPYVAVYDSQQKLKATFEQGATVDQIKAAIEKK